MKQFLQKLWSSPLKGTLLALPTIAIGVVVNHLAGSSGKVTLPAQTVIDVLLLWGGSLFSVCGVAYSYYQDLDRFKKEHEEEEQIRDGIPFRCGKRTGGKWMPFCPVCDRPADTSTWLKCPNPKCGWTAIKNRKMIEDIILTLPQ